MGFFGWLALLFVALKILGYITWSWWLVLLPLYWWVCIIVVLGLIAAAAK